MGASTGKSVPGTHLKTPLLQAYLYLETLAVPHLARAEQMGVSVAPCLGPQACWPHCFQLVTLPPRLVPDTCLHLGNELSKVLSCRSSQEDPGSALQPFRENPNGSGDRHQGQEEFSL